MKVRFVISTACWGDLIRDVELGFFPRGFFPRKEDSIYDGCDENNVSESSWHLPEELALVFLKEVCGADDGARFNLFVKNGWRATHNEAPMEHPWQLNAS